MKYPVKNMQMQEIKHKGQLCKGDVVCVNEKGVGYFTYTITSVNRKADKAYAVYTGQDKVLLLFSKEDGWYSGSVDEEPVRSGYLRAYDGNLIFGPVLATNANDETVVYSPERA